jgi:hypothetical protein
MVVSGSYHYLLGSNRHTAGSERLVTYGGNSLEENLPRRSRGVASAGRGSYDRPGVVRGSAIGSPEEKLELRRI